MLDKKTL